VLQNPRRLIVPVAMALTSCSVVSETLPPDARAIDVTAFGAVPNDGLDDTAAIQAAIDAPQPIGGAGKIVYLPNGVYDVSDRLLITTARETNRVTLMGESRAGTVIRLADASAGFTDASTPRSVVQTTSFDNFTAVQFRQSVQDLTIDAGVGNPGAIGLNYHTNNQGFVRDVAITGDGIVGLSINGSDRGPGMLSGIIINGFRTGIDAPGTEYSWVMEDITLSNQSREGIRNFWNILTIHGLTSTNSVPALWQDVETPNDFRWGMTTLINATLTGGDPSNPALLANGSVYLRNVTSAGYATLLEQERESAPFTSVAGEYTSDRVQRLVQVGHDMNDETQRQCPVFGRCLRIAHRFRELLQGTDRIPLLRDADVRVGLARRYGDVVPGTSRFLPELARVGAHEIRPSRGLGQGLAAENVFDGQPRLWRQIGLGNLGGDPMTGPGEGLTGNQNAAQHQKTFFHRHGWLISFQASMIRHRGMLMITPG